MLQVVCPTQRGSNNKRGPISEIRMNKIRCRYYSVISFPKEQNNHLRKPKRGDALGGGKDRIAKQRIKKNELLAPLTSMYVYIEREKNLQGNNIYHLKDVTNRTDEFLFYLLMPFSAREKVVQV